MGDHVPRELLSAEGMDQLLEVLSHRRRRLILFMLKRGEPLTESGLFVRGTSETDRVMSGERQIHLPKLADAGYIEWDRDTGDIAKGPQFEEIEPLLDLIENHSEELPPNWP